MARLDFVFSDKRPIYIIKQKLNVLSERKLSTSDYYTTVNRKWTLLINKSIVTYGRNKQITKTIGRQPSAVNAAR